MSCRRSRHTGSIDEHAKGAGDPTTISDCTIPMLYVSPVFLELVQYKESIVTPTLTANSQFLKSLDYKATILTATLTKP